jgi:hypothetical protein
MNIISLLDPPGNLHCPYTGRVFYGPEVDNFQGSIFFLYFDSGVMQIRKDFEKRVVHALEKMDLINNDDLDSLNFLLKYEFSGKQDNFLFYSVTDGLTPFSSNCVYGFAPGNYNYNEDDFVILDF